MFNRTISVALALLLAAGLCFAQTPGTFNPLLTAGTGVPAPVINYVTTANDNTNLTTYTFNSVSFGTAAAARYTVVCVGGLDTAGTFSVASATINGIAATRFGNAGASSLDVTASACFIAANPTGTSGTITATFSEGITSASIVVYRLINLAESGAAADHSGFVGSANTACPYNNYTATGPSVMVVFAFANSSSAITPDYASVFSAFGTVEDTNQFDTTDNTVWTSGSSAIAGNLSSTSGTIALTPGSPSLPIACSGGVFR